MFIINTFKCNAVEFNYSFCFCKIRTAGGCALHCICLTLKALSGYHACASNARASATHCATAQCGLKANAGWRVECLLNRCIACISDGWLRSNILLILRLSWSFALHYDSRLVEKTRAFNLRFYPGFGMSYCL